MSCRQTRLSHKSFHKLYTNSTLNMFPCRPLCRLNQAPPAKKKAVPPAAAPAGKKAKGVRVDVDADGTDIIPEDEVGRLCDQI